MATRAAPNLAASLDDHMQGFEELLHMSGGGQNVIDVSFIEMVQDEPEVVRLFGPILASRVDPEYRLA